MRILCLDDEPLALKMLEAAIREAKSDAEVTAFRKQVDLLEDAKQNGCDVAFLDIVKQFEMVAVLEMDPLAVLLDVAALVAGHFL